TAIADDFDWRGNRRAEPQGPKEPRCRDCRMHLHPVLHSVYFAVLPLTFKFGTRTAKLFASLAKVSAWNFLVRLEGSWFPLTNRVSRQFTYILRFPQNCLP